MLPWSLVLFHHKPSNQHQVLKITIQNLSNTGTYLICRFVSAVSQGKEQQCDWEESTIKPWRSFKKNSTAAKISSETFPITFVIN